MEGGWGLEFEIFWNRLGGIVCSSARDSASPFGLVGDGWGRASANSSSKLVAAASMT